MADSYNYVITPNNHAKVSYDERAEEYTINVSFTKTYDKGEGKGYSEYYIFYNKVDFDFIDDNKGSKTSHDVYNITQGSSSYFTFLEKKTNTFDSISFKIKKNAIPKNLFVWVYNIPVTAGIHTMPVENYYTYDPIYYSSSYHYLLQAAHVFTFPEKFTNKNLSNIYYIPPSKTGNYYTIFFKGDNSYSYVKDYFKSSTAKAYSITPAIYNKFNNVGKTPLEKWELYRQIQSENAELIQTVDGIYGQYGWPDESSPSLPSTNNPITYIVKSRSDWAYDGGTYPYSADTYSLTITEPAVPLEPTIDKVSPTSPNTFKELDNKNIKVNWFYRSNDGSTQVAAEIFVGFLLIDNETGFDPTDKTMFRFADNYKQFHIDGDANSIEIENTFLNYDDSVTYQSNYINAKAIFPTRTLKPVVAVVVWNYLLDPDNPYYNPSPSTPTRNKFSYTCIDYPIYLTPSISSIKTEGEEYFISQDKKENEKLKFELYYPPYTDLDQINNTSFIIEFIDPITNNIVCTYNKTTDVVMEGEIDKEFLAPQVYKINVSNINLFDNQFLDVSDYLQAQKEYILRITATMKNVKNFYCSAEETFYYDAIIPPDNQEFRLIKTDDGLSGAKAHVTMRSDQQGTNGEYLPRYITLYTYNDNQEIILLDEFDIISNYPTEINITELYNYHSDEGIYEFEIDTPAFYNLPLDKESEVYLKVTNGLNASRTMETPQKIKVESHGNIFLSFGETNSDIIKLRRNASFDVDENASQNLYNVLGRKYPLQYLGTNYTQDISISGDVKFPSEIYEWYAAHENVKSAYLRIPYGFTSYVAVNGISISKSEGLSPANISLDLTKIDNIK